MAQEFGEPSKKRRKLNDGGDAITRHDSEMSLKQLLLSCNNEKQNENSRMNTLLNGIDSLQDIRDLKSILVSLTKELDHREYTHPSLTISEKLKASSKLVNHQFKDGCWNTDPYEGAPDIDFDIDLSIGPNKTNVSLNGQISEYDGEYTGGICLSFDSKILWECIDELHFDNFDCYVYNIVDCMNATGLYGNNIINVNDEKDEIMTFVKQLTKLCYNESKEEIYVGSGEIVGWLNKFASDNEKYNRAKVNDDDKDVDNDEDAQNGQECKDME